MKKGLFPLGAGIKFQKTLTLGWPSVVNGVVTLVLEQVFMRLISWGDLGCLSMLLLESYLLG